MKGIARVNLPRKARDFDTEAKLELFRVESRALFRNFMKENCGKNGKQMSNLTAGEARGLKSLMKRMGEGELVVCPTDKTGKFAVMGRDIYESSGMVHTEGDDIVGWEDLKISQREVNGHTSMLAKIFRIGENWGHEDRVRETIMGEALQVCPIQLLYKDHKGWVKSMGKIPPTRQVAGGHRGINLHLSELVSDLMEPMVGAIKGGREAISTEDMVAKVEGVNKNMEGWTKTSWWEGEKVENYVACGTCEGKFDIEMWDEKAPELWTCGRTDSPDPRASKDNLKISEDPEEAQVGAEHGLGW